MHRSVALVMTTRPGREAPPALNDAIQQAMDDAGCDPETYSEDSLTVCAIHEEDNGWDSDRNECPVIARAVRIGWDEGDPCCV